MAHARISHQGSFRSDPAGSTGRSRTVPVAVGTGTVFAMLAAAACTQDFDQFEPVATGGSATGAQGGVAGDGGVGALGGSAGDGGVGAGGMGGMGGGCADPSECPTPNAPCTVATCEGMTCGEAPAALGTTCSDAGGVVCDDDGDCVECNTAADCSGANPACSNQQCVPDHCTNAAVDGDETDLNCGGSCPPCALGLDCMVFDDCETGVCDATVCVQCSGDPSCMGASTYCDNVTGNCTPQKAVGVACGGANECLMGNCIDAFCCDGPCGGECMDCAQSLTGAANGTCSQSNNGVAHAACGGSTCTGSTFTGAETCQAGSCSAPAPTACPGGHTCAATTCRTTCSNDGQCTGAFWCNEGMMDCLADQAAGAGNSCTNNNECVGNTNCVDGFCCDTACGSSCDACSVALGAASNGVCDDVTGAGNPTCSPYVCDGSGPICPTDCTVQGDCAATHYCDVNGMMPFTCELKLGAGSACNDDFECSSGNCNGSGSCVGN